MLDMGELERAIEELEARPSSLSNCSKLADLYIVRKHLNGEEKETPQKKPRAYSYADGPTGDSDFLRAVSKKDASAAWAVMDELMDTLKIVNGRVYESVMRKIENL